jgi:hypothetical protein
VVYVGSQITPTYETGTSSLLTTLGMLIHPVPASAYLLHYSYRYRHGTLVNDGDELNIPDHIADEIVGLAMARAWRTHIGNDPKLSDEMESSSLRRLDRKASRTSAQPMRRRTLTSHDRRRGRTHFGSRPSDPYIFHTE